MSDIELTNAEMCIDVRMRGASISYEIENIMLSYSQSCYRVPCKECALYIKGECLAIHLQLRRNELFKAGIIARRERQNTQIVK